MCTKRVCSYPLVHTSCSMGLHTLDHSPIYIFSSLISFASFIHLPLRTLHTDPNHLNNQVSNCGPAGSGCSPPPPRRAPSHPSSCPACPPPPMARSPPQPPRSAAARPCTILRRFVCHSSLIDFVLFTQYSKLHCFTFC